MDFDVTSEIVIQVDDATEYILSELVFRAMGKFNNGLVVDENEYGSLKNIFAFYHFERN